MDELDSPVAKAFRIFQAGWRAHETHVEEAEPIETTYRSGVKPVEVPCRGRTRPEESHMAHTWYVGPNHQAIYQRYCPGWAAEKPQPPLLRSRPCPWPMSSSCGAPRHPCPLERKHSQHDWHCVETHQAVQHCLGWEPKEESKPSPCWRIWPHAAHHWGSDYSGGFECLGI